MRRDLSEECPLVRVLLVLKRDGVHTTRSLGIAVGLSPATMKEMRDDLEEAGILDVARLPSGREDPVREIRLTPKGMEAATLAERTRALLLGEP